MAVTWNPSDKNADIVLSNGNLTASQSSTGFKSVRATDAKGSGKWYFEWILSGNQEDTMVGLANSSASLSQYIGQNTNGWSFFIASSNNVQTRYNSNGSAYLGLVVALGDVFMCAFDADNDKLWFGRNGTWLESGDPENGTNPRYSSVTGTLYPSCSVYDSTNYINARFKSTSFSYSPPVGFSAWEISTVDLPRLIQTMPPHNSGTIARLGL